MHHSRHLQKEAIKEKIFKQLKDDELQIISYTENKEHIYWEEDGKEFLFNGEMYDVVKTTIVDNKTILYCINDKKEKALVEKYNSITKQNSSSDKKGKNNIDNSINLFIHQIENSRNGYFIISLHDFSYYNSLTVDCIVSKISPPPKA